MRDHLAGKTCCFLLEATNTLSSRHVWGDEILARSLARYLAPVLRCVVLSKAEGERHSPARPFDFCIHFREHFPKWIAGVNVFYFQNARESFHDHLTTQQWLDRCVGDHVREFDLIAVPSLRLCEEVRRAGGRPLLLRQFADTAVYKPVEPEIGLRSDVAYVSNNIKGETVNSQWLYPVAEFCASNRLTLALYGAGWESSPAWNLLRRFHRGVLHPNLVPRVYSSASVVLNLHFQSHRHWGVATSRLFETLACGAVAVSDFVDEAADLFAQSTFFAKSPPELLSCIQAALSLTADDRLARAAIGRASIDAQHSARVRARELLRTLNSIKHASPHEAFSDYALDAETTDKSDA